MTERQSKKQLQEVRFFFDSISDGYTDKYEAVKPFHRWYFRDRLEKTMRYFPKVENSKVLDIGAGTGALYQKVQSLGLNVHYLACDISEGMLNRSTIPPAQRFVGSVYDAIDDSSRFDWVAMLGVTTYLSEEELNKNLNFIRGHLNPGGILAITFTHKKAIGVYAYKILSPIMRFFGFKKGVAAQDFYKAAFSIDEIKSILKVDYELVHFDFLNQTIFPLNHLLPRLSIRIAERIQRKSAGWLLSVTSNEILVHARLKGSH